MTEYELNQIIAEHTSTLNQLTEFWLTISFGVIVAATYIPNKFGRRFYNMLFYGYLCTSLIFLSGRANFTYMSYEIGARLLEFGYEPIPFHPFFGAATSIGIFLMMTLGSIGILTYIRYVSRSVHDSDT
jgi:hypothetical protein